MRSLLPEKKKKKTVSHKPSLVSEPLEGFRCLYRSMPSLLRVENERKTQPEVRNRGGHSEKDTIVRASRALRPGNLLGVRGMGGNDVAV